MKKKPQAITFCPKNVCILVAGAILTSLGATTLYFYPEMFQVILKEALKIAPDSEAFLAWSKTTEPLVVDFYFFNWTNPNDMNNKTVRPKFVQCGPYRFTEIKDKINVTWNANDTMTYRHFKQFFFDEENSAKDLSEMITTINTISLTAAFRARNWSYFPKRGLSTMLSVYSKHYITKSVRELLFDGFMEPFMSTVRSFSFGDPTIKDKFGFFYQRNNSVGEDGVYNMATSSDSKYGTLLAWNYKNHTPYYEGVCGLIKGSSGELYPTHRTKNESIRFFSSEMCRYLILDYEEEITVKNINAYKYDLSREVFDNGTLNPENSCFCAGECMPVGVLNVSTCRSNSPVFLSLPHFYGGDPFYVNSIEGVRPEKDKHQLHIALEPKSGVIVNLAARMQLNFLVQPIKSISMFEKAQKFVLPVFWFDQPFDLTDNLSEKLWLIQNLEYFNTIFSFSLISLGLLLLSYLLVFLVCKSLKDSKLANETKDTKEEIPL